MYIKQNKMIELEPRRNIELYNIQLKSQHTPVQVNGLVWVEIKLTISNISDALKSLKKAKRVSWMV